MDADMAVDPDQIPRLVAATHHADLAIGSRSIVGSSVECDSFRRALMGRTFSRLVNTLTDVGIRDTQCGFKAFRAPAARLLFHCMMIDRFAFDVELLSLARQFGFRISEVPVHWRDVIGSAVRPLADPLSMTADVLRLRMGRPSLSVPGLMVEGAPPSVLFAAFGDTVPVIERTEDCTLVLFPLCDVEFVRSAATRINEVALQSTVSECTLSISDLQELAPLSLLTRDTTETSKSSYADMKDLPRPVPPTTAYRDTGRQAHLEPSFRTGS
jgi:hypothetical protein